MKVKIMTTLEDIRLLSRKKQAAFSVKVANFNEWLVHIENQPWPKWACGDAHLLFPLDWFRQAHISLEANKAYMANPLLVEGYIASNLEQLWTLPAEQLYFDFVEMNTHAQSITYQVYGCAREVLDPVLEWLHARKISVCQVSPWPEK